MLNVCILKIIVHLNINNEDKKLKIKIVTTNMMTFI